MPAELVMFYNAENFYSPQKSNIIGIIFQNRVLRTGMNKDI